MSEPASPEEPSDRVIPLLARLWAWAYRLFFLLLMAGGYSGILGWRPGAYMAITGMLGLIASHLTIGLIAYRHVMSRPWPKVAPLSDDDW